MTEEERSSAGQPEMTAEEPAAESGAPLIEEPKAAESPVPQPELVVAQPQAAEQTTVQSAEQPASQPEAAAEQPVAQAPAAQSAAIEPQQDEPVQPDEENAEPQSAEHPAKSGFGTVATFWLLLLYGFPGIGLIASALSGFLFAKTRSHRSLARACFAWNVIMLVVAGVLVGGYFFLRSRFALSNFLERILQDALNFVRSNSDKL